MNDYPLWWNATLTIFHKWEDKLTRVVTWYPHTVDQCFWKYAGNKVVVGDVTINSEQVVCRIPEDALYLEPYQWAELSPEDKENYFTIAPGDIIVKGKVEETIDEYTSGKRSTDFLKKYKALQGCMQVGRVAIDTGEGLCCEHYYITGE